VNDIGEEAGLSEEFTAANGLGDTLLIEVDIDPAGEKVFSIPLALTVAEQDERIRGIRG
jgi:hypothetical protein